jgi:hypothetical protein
VIDDDDDDDDDVRFSEFWLRVDSQKDGSVSGKHIVSP